MPGSYTEPDEFQPNLYFIVLYSPVHEGITSDFLRELLNACLPEQSC